MQEMIRRAIEELEPGKVLVLNQPSGFGKTTTTIETLIDKILEGKANRVLCLFQNHRMAEEFYNKGVNYYQQKMVKALEKGLEIKHVHFLHLLGFDKIHETQCQLSQEEQDKIELLKAKGIANYPEIIKPLHLKRLHAEGKVCPYYAQIQNLQQYNVVFSVHDYLSVEKIMQVGWDYVVIDENPINSIKHSFELTIGDLDDIIRGIKKFKEIIINEIQRQSQNQELVRNHRQNINQNNLRFVIRSTEKYENFAFSLKRFLEDFEQNKSNYIPYKIKDEERFYLDYSDYINNNFDKDNFQMVYDFFSNYLASGPLFNLPGLDFEFSGLDFELQQEILTNYLQSFKANKFQKILSALVKTMQTNELDNFIFKPIPPTFVNFMKFLVGLPFSLLLYKSKDFREFYISYDTRTGARKIVFTYVNNVFKQYPEQTFIICDASSTYYYEKLVEESRLKIATMVAQVKRNVVQIIDAYYPFSTLKTVDSQGLYTYKNKIELIKKIATTPKPSVIARKEIIQSMPSQDFGECAHFWSLRGTNRLQDVKELFILGCPEPNPMAVWETALLFDPFFIEYEKRYYRAKPYFVNEDLNRVLNMMREEEIVQAIERQRWWLGSGGKICYVFSKLKLPFPTMKMSERRLLLLSILIKVLNDSKQVNAVKGLGELVDEIKTYKEISLKELVREIDDNLRQIGMGEDKLGWKDKKMRLPELLKLLACLGFIKLKLKGSHKDKNLIVYVLERFSMQDIVERFFNFNFNGN
jgi:hypothetical protein